MTDSADIGTFGAYEWSAWSQVTTCDATAPGGVLFSVVLYRATGRLYTGA